MRQCIHAIAVILVIQENKGLRTICPAAIRTTAFAKCLKDIDPALRQTLLEHAYIVFP